MNIFLYTSVEILLYRSHFYNLIRRDLTGILPSGGELQSEGSSAKIMKPSLHTKYDIPIF